MKPAPSATELKSLLMKHLSKSAVFVFHNYGLYRQESASVITGAIEGSKTSP